MTKTPVELRGLTCSVEQAYHALGLGRKFCATSLRFETYTWFERIYRSSQKNGKARKEGCKPFCCPSFFPGYLSSKAAGCERGSRKFDECAPPERGAERGAKMHRIRNAALLFIISGLVVALTPVPSNAVYTVLAPSYGINRPLNPPISGKNHLKLYAVPIKVKAPECILPCPGPLAPSSNTPQCPGCNAFSWMYYTDYGDHEKVNTASMSSQASEDIDELNVHGVLIRGRARCGTQDAYDGTQLWADSKSNTNSWNVAIGEATEFGGTNNTWTQAGGMGFNNQGGSWAFENGELDMCMMF
jgi:hypothetical protein